MLLREFSLRSVLPAVLALCLVPAVLHAAEAPLSWSVGGPPYPAAGSTAVLDSIRGRLIVSGGGSSNDLGDTWALDLTTKHWSRLHWRDFSGYWRADHSAVYDAPRDRMIVYGGIIPGESSDPVYGQFALNGAGWSPLSYGTSYPGARTSRPVLVLDAARSQMLLLGGNGAPASPFYRSNLTTDGWTSVSAAGSPPILEFGQTAIVDAPRNRVVAVSYDGVYQLTLIGTPTWSKLTTAGSGPPLPGGLVTGDPLRNRLLFVANDMRVFALTLTGTPTWSLVASGGTAPAARTRFMLVRDGANDRALLYGGVRTSDGAGLNDTWAFNCATNTWSLFDNPGVLPVRQGHSATRAAARDAMVLFGGANGPGNDTWLFPLAGNAPMSPLVTAGTLPTGRQDHAAAYDSQRNRLLVYGGTALTGGAFLADVRALTLDASPTWSEIVAPGGPGARAGASAMYDAVRDRLLVFGGYEAGFVYHRDVWALTLGGTPTWTRLLDDSALPPLLDQGFAELDFERDRVVAVGAVAASSRVGAWTLPLGSPTAWSLLAAPGTGPGALLYLQGAFDDLSDRLVLCGGIDITGAQVLASGAWTLSLTRPDGWHHFVWDANNITGPFPRAFAKLVRDPLRLRSWMIGGQENPTADRFGASFVHHLWVLNEDASTPALASLTAAEVSGDAARLEWWVTDADYATWRVERSITQGEWTDVGPAADLGEGRLEFRESGLTEGATIGYRLVASENGIERRMGEAWITVPSAHATLALSRVSLTSGTLRYSATLPGGAEARIDVYDVGGRRLGGTSLGAARGERQGTFEMRSDGASGVYFVRLSQGGRSAFRKVARLD